MIRRFILVTTCLLSPAIAPCSEPGTNFVEHISALVGGRTGRPIKIKKGDAAVTKESFTPPVEIEIVAKTDSAELRMSYAADQVIFNWGIIPSQLRVDGGPANGNHKPGVGFIPVNKYVTIRWIVTPKRQVIFVDGEQRYEHSGDYSRINNPVSVFTAGHSEVSVKSIKVRGLSEGTE